MDREFVDRPGEALAAEVRAELRRIGFSSVVARYIAERHVLRISWPHQTGAGAEEGVEVPASRERAERMVETLRAHVRTERRAAQSGVA